MLSVGSHVVHPCYGAGTVARIQDKTIGDQTRAYYVIETAHQPMELMVPVSRVEEVGLRPVGDSESLERALHERVSSVADLNINDDLRARQAKMREDLKSGDFGTVLSVVRTVYYLSTQRTLGTTDRELLDRGRNLVAGELALASGQDVAAARAQIEDALRVLVEGIE